MHSSRVHLMVTPEEVMAHRDDVVKCASGNKKYKHEQKRIDNASVMPFH